MCSADMQGHAFLKECILCTRARTHARTQQRTERKGLRGTIVNKYAEQSTTEDRVLMRTHTCIYIHTYICTSTHFTHNDGAINSQLKVIQGCPHCLNHTLHSVNLLTQEDVHWCKCTHLLQHGLHLHPIEEGTQDGQHQQEARHTLCRPSSPDPLHCQALSSSVKCAVVERV